MDIFLIFHTRDTAETVAEGWRVKGEEAARETVRTCFKRPEDACVIRITEGELSRNVTADFVPEPVRATFADDYAHADHFRRVIGARL